MIKIHSAIITGFNTIDITVETIPGETIERVLLYKLKDFRDPSKAIDFSFMLEKKTNIEKISIEPKELGIKVFDDVYLIDIRSSEENIENNCDIIYNEGLALVSNFIKYEQCLIEKAMRIHTSGCVEDTVYEDCEDCNNTTLQGACYTSTLYNALKSALQNGFYEEAKKIQEELDCLCKPCKNCPEYTNSKFFNGFGFGTFDNSVMLI